MEKLKRSIRQKIKIYADEILLFGATSFSLLAIAVMNDWYGYRDFSREQYNITRGIPQNLNEMEQGLVSGYLDKVANNLHYFISVGKYGDGLLGGDKETPGIVRPIREIAYDIGVEYICKDDGFGFKVPAERWSNIRAIRNLKEINHDRLLNAAKEVEARIKGYNKQDRHYIPIFTPVCISLPLLIIGAKRVRGYIKNRT